MDFVNTWTAPWKCLCNYVHACFDRSALQCAALLCDSHPDCTTSSLNVLSYISIRRVFLGVAGETFFAPPSPPCWLDYRPACGFDHSVSEVLRVCAIPFATCSETNRHWTFSRRQNNLLLCNYEGRDSIIVRRSAQRCYATLSLDCTVSFMHIFILLCLAAVDFGGAIKL